MKAALSIILISAVNAILYMISSSIHSGAYYGDFSCKGPPPICDHLFMHQGWSLTRELTVNYSVYINDTVTYSYSQPTVLGTLKAPSPGNVKFANEIVSCLAGGKFVTRRKGKVHWLSLMGFTYIIPEIINCLVLCKALSKFWFNFKPCFSLQNNNIYIKWCYSLCVLSCVSTLNGV